MNCLGGELFAGPTLPRNEDIYHTVPDPLDEPDHLLDLLPRPDNAVAGVFVLDLPPEAAVLLGQFVLAAPQFADQLGGLDGIGGVRRERLQGFLVAGGEDADALVQHFEGADDLAALVADGDGEDVAGTVSGLAVDGGVEARVAVGIADVDGLAGGDGAAGDADAGVEAQDVIAAESDLGPQLLALAVEEENAGAVAIEQTGGFAGDDVEERAQ